MKISVDLDGVLIQIMEEWVRIYNDIIEPLKHVTIEVVTQWDFWKDLPISEDEMIDIFGMIDIVKVPIIDKKAPKYLKKLNKIHDVDIVTARYKGEADRPKVQAKLDLMGLVKGVHYNELVVLPNQPKDIKLRRDYDVYIDDSPYLAKSFQEYGVYEEMKLLLLPQQPWNWKIESKRGVVRVRGWKEIMKWLK